MLRYIVSLTMSSGSNVALFPILVSAMGLPTGLKKSIPESFNKLLNSCSVFNKPDPSFYSSSVTQEGTSGFRGLSSKHFRICVLSRPWSPRMVQIVWHYLRGTIRPCCSWKTHNGLCSFHLSDALLGSEAIPCSNFLPHLLTRKDFSWA